MRQDDSTAVLIPSTEEAAAEGAAIASRFNQCMSSRSVLLASNALNDGLSLLNTCLVMTALTGRWCHQFFRQLEHYDAAPSLEAQQTWLSLILMGVAGIMGITIELTNYRYSKKNPGKHLAVEHYVYEAFASSIIFFILDAISTSGHIGALPLGWFITITVACIPLIVGSLCKLTLPDLSKEFICSLTQLNAFNPPQYLDASRFERRLNMFTGIITYAGPSIGVLFSVVNREDDGEKTIPLLGWQKGLIALYLLFSTKVGFELTHHPKFFQTYAQFSRLIKEGALCYYAISAIFYAYFVYQSPTKTFSISDDAREYLTYTSFCIALAMGLYSAATTRVRFEEIHESNLRMMKIIKATPDNLRAIKETVTKGCSSAANFFKECCRRDIVRTDKDEQSAALLYSLRR